MFIEGMNKDDFLADKRTKGAVVMSLIVIGEATTRILDRYPAFAVRHPEISWQAMRGMRNRIPMATLTSTITSFGKQWRPRYQACSRACPLSVMMRSVKRRDREGR